MSNCCTMCSSVLARLGGAICWYCCCSCLSCCWSCCLSISLLDDEVNFFKIEPDPEVPLLVLFPFELKLSTLKCVNESFLLLGLRWCTFKLTPFEGVVAYAIAAEVGSMFFINSSSSPCATDSFKGIVSGDGSRWSVAEPKPLLACITSLLVWLSLALLCCCWGGTSSIFCWRDSKNSWYGIWSKLVFHTMTCSSLPAEAKYSPPLENATDRAAPWCPCKV